MDISYDEHMDVCRDRDYYKNAHGECLKELNRLRPIARDYSNFYNVIEAAYNNNSMKDIYKALDDYK